MSKVKRHKNYDDYIKLILSCPNYQELLQVDAQYGKFNWLGPLTTPKGKARRAWWNQQCQKLNIDTTKKGCYAEVARAIHPTQQHVCQCCGKSLSLDHVYPKLPITKKLNQILGIKFKQSDYTIQEIVSTFCVTQEFLDAVSELFKGRKGYNQEELLTHIKLTGNAFLSPGVMSNSPDRFDGFHSYGLCCRKIKDKGRHDANMNLYGQDRRAYAEWADGDYNKANKLMGAFRNAPRMICPKCSSKAKRTMTADHIGPLSLGFCHSTHFAPMCRNCNSSKNNRLSKADVDALLKLESEKETVVSWHSKYAWDKLKNTINNDDDALKLSKIMNSCHKNVLYLFYLIYSATGEQFLMRYLHPEYSMYNHRITNLDLGNLTKMKITSTPSNSKNKQNSKERYIRIAFESLTIFGEKRNRKIKIIIEKDSHQVKEVISLIDHNKDDAADRLINKIIESTADTIINSYKD